MDRTFTQKKISTTLKAAKNKNGKQNDLSHQPSNETIFAILNYSKSLTVKNSNTVDTIELMLN